MEKYGSSKLVYEHVENWGMVPKGFSLSVVAGISVDSHDQIYVLSRGRPAIIVFDKNGKYLDSWDKSEFVRPHGIFIDEDDNIFCVDDGAHVVYKYNKKRELMMTLGDKGIPSDTGVITNEWKVEHSGPPFNRPTDIAISKTKDLYITDGYGNACVHMFNSDGTLVFSWGDPGNKPGQFYLPHSVAINEKTVYIADRENGRIQLFTLDGEFIEEWTNLLRPASLFIDSNNLLYVGECKRTSVFDGSPSRIAIFKLNGELLTRLEKPNDMWPKEGCPYRAIHNLCVDSFGSIYVAEVGRNVPVGYFGIHKYVRI